MKTAKINTCNKCKQIVMLDLQCTCDAYLYRWLDLDKSPITKWNFIRLNKLESIEDMVERLCERRAENENDNVFCNVEVKKMDTDKRVGIYSCEISIEIIKETSVEVEKVDE